MLDKTLSDQGFVEACYQVFLGRPADETGLAAFVSFLSTNPREDAVRNFIASPEFRARFLKTGSFQLGMLAAVRDPSLDLMQVDAEGVTMKVPPYSVTLGDRKIMLHDYPGAVAARLILEELERDAYGLEKLALPEAPIIVDVGAHIGLFSIACLLRWPKARVIAFEPVPSTFALLEANFRLNGLKGDLRNIGLSGDSRTLSIQFDPWGNSGAASATYGRPLRLHATVEAPTTTLDSVLKKAGVEHVDLLKLDCEGLEYEILETPDLSRRVSHLRAEVHDSYGLQAKGLVSGALIAKLKDMFPPERLKIETADKRPEENRAA